MNKYPVAWFVGVLIFSWIFGMLAGPDTFELYVMIVLSFIVAKQVEILNKLYK